MINTQDKKIFEDDFNHSLAFLCFNLTATRNIFILFKTFYPQKQRHMGAAPCAPHPRVLAALAKPPISHLCPEFLSMMSELRVLLQRLLKTENTFTIPFQGPASGAMESAIVNLLEPEDKIIICINGLYGERMADMAERRGLQVIRSCQEWGEAVDGNILEDLLKQHKDALFVGLVHTETMSGTRSDLESLSRLIHDYGRHVIVDATGTILNAPFLTDEWKIDVAFTNVQKCIASAAGLAPLTLTDEMISRIQRRKTNLVNWCMDLNPIIKNWYKNDPVLRTYHHNPAINLLYALHEAIVLVEEKGGVDAFVNHQARLGRILKKALGFLGISDAFPLQKDLMIPNMLVWEFPKNLNHKDFHKHLLDDYHLCIGEGLGKFAGRVFRISTMGHCTEDDIFYCLQAMKSAMLRFDVAIPDAGACISSLWNQIMKEECIYE